MTREDILNIIRIGEGKKIEFKTSSNKLPTSLFETVCSFLNTVGGTIVLGVDDSGKIIGIDNNVSSKFKKGYCQPIQ